MASLRYQPPAVEYTLAQPWLVVLLMRGLWMVAAALLCAWLMGTGPLPVMVKVVGGLLWCGAGMAVWRSQPGVAQGLLRWDGGAWWWRPLGDMEWQPLELLQVHWDGQAAMLLQWRTATGRRHYGWVERRSAPWRWGDWRRAVYSATTVSRAAGDGGQPPFAA